jgi:hypothetical protein
MYIISHKATFLSTSFTNKPRVVMFVKSFVSLFIPVLRDTKTKHSRLVTSVCFDPTRPDDGASSMDCTSLGIFLPDNSLKSAG